MATRSEVLQKVMDYLGMRDHSKHELLQKLKRFEFEPEHIEYAIKHVEDSGWLLPPDVLAEKVAQHLHRKKKGYFYILAYLKQKKLPSVRRDGEIELEKAKKLIQGRFSRLSKASQSDKKQIAQFLKNRGFDGETIAKVIHETSGNSKSIY